MDFKYFKTLNLPQYNLQEALSTVDWQGQTQICLNSIPGKEHDQFFGNGSLYYDWSRVKYDESGNIVELPKYDEPLKEEDFTEVCDYFKGTIFEEMYNMLKQQYPLGRVRLMYLKPVTVMTWHQDYGPRIHYPIKTQEGCFMVIEDELLHLKQDQWYYTETTMKHTAFNSSKEERIHFVAAVTQ